MFEQKIHRKYGNMKKFYTENQLLILIIMICFTVAGHAQDWRNIRNGAIIPNETYSDQPYIVQTDDGAWLCILTTGAGREGASGQYVATTRSLDKGKSWSDLVPLEPPEGPEASYAVMLKVNTGRIYAFYNHNADNVREIITDKGSTITRVDSQGYFVFKYSDDHGKSWSKDRYTVQVREFEIDRNNVYGGSIRFFWNVGKSFIYKGSGYVPLIKVGGFGDGFFTSNEGVLLKSSNILTERDPEKIIWETLPEGDVGLCTPTGGGPIAGEQSYSVMSDGSLFCVYRTIDGHPVHTYSRDEGYTWDTPQYLRYSNGRLVKQPRAANFAWRCENGKYLYWFHNHGGRFIREHPDRPGMAYNDRNPAWISGGIEKDGPGGRIIEWTQPEILLYDDDPIIRMSYPDLVQENGEYFITETQKDIARVHRVDENLLELLWKQLEISEKATGGLGVEWDFRSVNLPVSKKGIHFEPFYIRDPIRDDHGGLHVLSGFTIDMVLNLTKTDPGQLLIDSRDKFGIGISLSTTADDALLFTMSDGRAVSSWTSDKGMILANHLHHVSVIVDGGPKIIMFVIDGILNDGGDQRQFGWGRFNPYMQDVTGDDQWIFGNEISGSIDHVRVYKRALKVTEAIGNFRYLIKH